VRTKSPIVGVGKKYWVLGQKLEGPESRPCLNTIGKTLNNNKKEEEPLNRFQRGKRQGPKSPKKPWTFHHTPSSGNLLRGGEKSYNAASQEEKKWGRKRKKYKRSLNQHIDRNP